MKHARQGGFALPILLILLSALTVFVANRTLQTFGGLDLRASLRTDIALRNARDALIRYAVWEDSSPGALLCPDTDGDGNADGSCKANEFGLFPWRTLGIERPLDGAGECLWYAISPGARSFLKASTRGTGGTQPALNPSYPGELQLHDAASGTSSTVVAVLIAPGRSLAGQARSNPCGKDVASNYLDSRDGISNAADGIQFITGPSSATFNDRVLAISSAELFRPVIARVVIELAGRDAAATTGLRRMFHEGTSPETLAAGDGTGRLALNFQSPAVLSVFSPPQEAPTPVGDCSYYKNSPNNYTAEWLCFNRWLDFTNYTPRAADSASIAMPSWRAEFSVSVPPKLLRTP